MGLLLILTGIAPLFAIDVRITPPEFRGKDTPPGLSTEISLDDFERTLNEQIRDSFIGIQAEIDRQVKDIDSDPQKLIGAFADSSVFSSDGASQRGYGGYKRFAVTFGSMIGFQLPASPFSMADEIEHIGGRLEDEHDIKLGVNPQVINAQLGINTSRFLLKDLYLGLKFGFMKLDINDISFDSFSLGGMGSYQLMANKIFASGLFLWRGINVRTGLIYQRTNFTYDFPLDTMYEEIAVTYEVGSNEFSYPIGVAVKPKLNLNFNVNTVTIPLEAMTSIRLFWFMNLAFGLGADVAFGRAELNVSGSANADINCGTLDTYLEQTKSAGLWVNMGGANGPSLFNPKIMTALGFSLGPVIIDIPVTFYLDHGYNFGVTLGAAW